MSKQRIITKIKNTADKINSSIPILIYSFKDGETPIVAKIILGLAICYAFSPIDLIPDFIPILGYLDDIIILPLLICLAIRLIPENVLNRAKSNIAAKSDTPSANHWYYSIPIIFVWILIIGVILHAVFS